MEQNLAKAVDNTDEILALITHAKGAAGFARKYAPRAVTFVLGYLVLSGKMSAETQQLFRSLFGG